MEKIPFISSTPGLNKRILDVFTKEELPVAELFGLTTLDTAMEYLDLEMPDLILVNFSDPDIDNRTLIKNIQSDPWLHHGGIVGICDSYDDIRELGKMRDLNIIVIIHFDDLERDLPRVMKIIFENRRILFQHEIGVDFLENISASYKLHNNILEARCYANLVCNFLYNSHKIDSEGKYGVNIALTEMLINAIEHGNCSINYDDKSAVLNSGGLIEELIEEKCRDAVIASRRVIFEYTLEKDRARFVIADEGDGFDWKEFSKPIADDKLFELHGRGIVMSRTLVGGLQYNDKGNVVSFEIPFKTEIEMVAPGLFAHIEPREVRDGDIIFKEGEPSDFLYYIVKGHYEVMVNNTVVSSLCPDDVFMGEMSFLLNNKRSAGVRARTDGKLIEISKKAFVEAIKRKPHYAIFLSRLLAQRIQRLNSASAAKLMIH